MQKQVWSISLFLFLPLLALAQRPLPHSSDKNKDSKSAAEQDIIYLENPSFEDIPRAALPPSGWLDCGPLSETPPDVQPYGGFRCTRVPQNGNTYLGLVTRDNNTWESVGQRLSKPMRQNQCYDFNFYATRSPIYESATKKDPMRSVNFDKGVTIRIWGGNNMGERAEMLAQTDVIESTEWKNFKVKLKPTKGNFSYICVEAYYKTPTLFPYNGNVLVDNLSPISACDVPDNPLAQVDPKKEEPKKNPVNVSPKTTTTTPSTKVDTPKVDTAKIAKVEDKKTDFTPELRTQDLKIGDIFRLSNLYFSADSTNINRMSERTLNELYNFLKKNPNVNIEIGGHTNGIPDHAYCDRLSTERARNVANYLLEKGIPAQQIQFKGYGKRQPIDNDSSPIGRERNQRVEVKILSK